MKIGLLPLGRSTFDVEFAESQLAGMLALLDATEHDLAGPRQLLFDGDAAAKAIAALGREGVDLVLVLQVTFTDAGTVLATANAFPDTPLAIWSVPEPRLGGRLRLNAFCGLNLAAHALGRAERGFGWLHAAPEAGAADELARLLAGERPAGRLDAAPPGPPDPVGQNIAARIAGKRIARIGAHPDGFETCRYSPDDMRALAGVLVDEFPLETLFGTARACDAGDVGALRTALGGELADLDAVDQDQLDRSLRIARALETLGSGGGYDAFAVRCWPEAFTEYGGAVCGPAAMLGERRVPCACEADVYGALTQLVLSEAAGAPVFLTDLVDMDTDDDTAVVWHCGQAPLSMRDPDVEPRATIHTNRRMPLLFEFPLKPGQVTFLRISQAFNDPRMVLGYGEMLKRDKAFTGTSGVVRFAGGTQAALDRLIASGLEHHMALAYGDHRDTLRSVAAAMELPVLELTQ